MITMRAILLNNYCEEYPSLLGLKLGMLAENKAFIIVLGISSFIPNRESREDSRRTFPRKGHPLLYKSPGQEYLLGVIKMVIVLNNFTKG